MTNKNKTVIIIFVLKYSQLSQIKQVEQKPP